MLKTKPIVSMLTVFMVYLTQWSHAGAADANLSCSGNECAELGRGLGLMSLFAVLVVGPQFFPHSDLDSPTPGRGLRLGLSGSGSQISILGQSHVTGIQSQPFGVLSRVYFDHLAKGRDRLALDLAAEWAAVHTTDRWWSVVAGVYGESSLQEAGTPVGVSFGVLNKNFISSRIRNETMLLATFFEAGSRFEIQETFLFYSIYKNRWWTELSPTLTWKQHTLEGTALFVGLFVSSP